MLSLSATGYVTGKPKIQDGDYGAFTVISLRCKGDNGKHIFYVNAKFFGKRITAIEKYVNDGDQMTVCGTVSAAVEKVKKDSTKYTQIFMSGAGFALAPPPSANSGPGKPAATSAASAEEEDDIPF